MIRVSLKFILKACLARFTSDILIHSYIKSTETLMLFGLYALDIVFIQFIKFDMLM